MKPRFFKQANGEILAIPILSAQTMQQLQTLCEESEDIRHLLINKLPKTDLHIHAEAGFLMDIELAKKIAERNQVLFPDDLIDVENHCWKFSGSDNLEQFVKDFKRISALIKTAEDIEDIIYAFYKYCYDHNVIYALPGISWVQCKKQMSFLDFNHAYNRGLLLGIKEFGSISTLRLRYYQERHVSEKEFRDIWENIKQYPNPMITTIGLAGIEEGFPLENFLNFFEVLNQYRKIDGNPWYFITAHIEPEAQKETLERAKNLLDWFGHGRNVANFPETMREIKKSGMTLELCPLSDVAFFPASIPDLDAHYQFKKLFNNKMVSLNSDDPAFCKGIHKVYEDVYEALNCDLSLLYHATINGLSPAAKRTMHEMQMHSPDAFDMYQEIRKNGILKLNFFAIYCSLLTEIVSVLADEKHDIKKRLLKIDLHTSLNELNDLACYFSQKAKMTSLPKLMEIKNEILKTAKVLEMKTLNQIHTFENSYPLDWVSAKRVTQ